MFPISRDPPEGGTNCRSDEDSAANPVSNF